MSDERTTSNAKSVDLDSYTEHLLDSHNELQAEFGGASQERVAVQDNQAGQQEGSTMVEGNAPINDLRPPSEMARDQDRETYIEKMAADDAKAKARDEYLAQLSKGYEEDKDLHNDQARDAGNEFSR